MKKVESTEINKILLRNQFDYYVLIFFFGSFIGWIWEGILYRFYNGIWVNRGILLGPYLPIYGVASVLLSLIAFFANQIRQNAWRCFLVSVIICSLLEYFTGFILEKRWNRRWWDYEGSFLNVQGRICFISVICFGFMGMWFLRSVMPFFIKKYSAMTLRKRVLLCCVLLGIFLVDAAYCTDHPQSGRDWWGMS